MKGFLVFPAKDTEEEEATGLGSLLAVRLREREKAMSPIVLTRKIKVSFIFLKMGS